MGGLQPGTLRSPTLLLEPVQMPSTSRLTMYRTINARISISLRERWTVLLIDNIVSASRRFLKSRWPMGVTCNGILNALETRSTASFRIASVVSSFSFATLHALSRFNRGQELRTAY